MANVHQRLQLHYGPAYGIEVFSKPGEGTDVILSLPLPGLAAGNGRKILLRRNELEMEDCMLSGVYCTAANAAPAGKRL